MQGMRLRFGVSGLSLVCSVLRL
ncbi:hypothetical protein LINPERPRIM_LOCUS1895 [Linum perenne]